MNSKFTKSEYLENTQDNKKRVKTLDITRGILAFGVMIYHYISWSYIKNNNLEENLVYNLSKIGIYAVEGFFVLSGFSLVIAYKDRLLLNKKSLISFAIKRYFRIAPLFYLVIIANIIPNIVIKLIKLAKTSQITHDIVFSTVFNAIKIESLIANISLLFGFINPDLSLITGGWSIGLEIIFYILFPWILYFFNKDYFKLLILLVVSISIAILYNIQNLPYFWGVNTPSETSFHLDIFQSFDSAWTLYVNPHNHLFFFISGILIYPIFTKLATKNINNTIIFSMIFLNLFTFWNLIVQKIHPAIGYQRFIFSALTISLILLTSLVNLENIKYKYLQVINFLEWLGIISYSLYLVHPLVWDYMSWIHKYNINYFTIICMCILFSIIISSYIYVYFEKIFISYGKNISLRILK